MHSTAAVIICAFSAERWDDLLAAYDSVRAQTIPADIIVVIDHNDALLERAIAAMADAQVLTNESVQGLSGARNTGVAYATADLVLFLDDDAVASPTWVERMTAPFTNPAVVGVGGFASPNWDGGQAPGWLPHTFYWVVGCSYDGLPTDGLRIRNPIGASMALRRAAVVDAGGFATSIGRIGSKPLGCEETELSIRLTQRDPDTYLVHAVTATVDHRVRDDRQRLAYFSRRCYWEGVSKAQVARLTGATHALSAERGFIIQTLPRLLSAPARSIRARSFTPLQQAAVTVWGIVAAGTGYVRGQLAPAPSPVLSPSVLSH